MSMNLLMSMVRHGTAPDNSEEELSYDDEGFVISTSSKNLTKRPVTMIKTERWVRLFSGVSKAESLKLLVQSHKKRLHNLNNYTSKPFKTLSE
jgi:hypothetical protein